MSRDFYGNPDRTISPLQRALDELESKILDARALLREVTPGPESPHAAVAGALDRRLEDLKAEVAKLLPPPAVAARAADLLQLDRDEQKTSICRSADWVDGVRELLGQLAAGARLHVDEAIEQERQWDKGILRESLKTIASDSERAASMAKRASFLLTTYPPPWNNSAFQSWLKESQAFLREIAGLHYDPVTETVHQVGVDVEARRAITELVQVADRDVRRYQRLRILGCAPGNSWHLTDRTVMRFQNLDDFLDEDLKLHASRGEAREPPRARARCVDPGCGWEGTTSDLQIVRACPHCGQDVRLGRTFSQIQNEIIQKVGMMASARTPEMRARLDAAIERRYQPWVTAIRADLAKRVVTSKGERERHIYDAADRSRYCKWCDEEEYHPVHLARPTPGITTTTGAGSVVTPGIENDHYAKALGWDDRPKFAEGAAAIRERGGGPVAEIVYEAPAAPLVPEQPDQAVTAQEAIRAAGDEMHRALVALYSEVPQSVADEVSRLHHAVVGAFQRRLASPSHELVALRYFHDNVLARCRKIKEAHLSTTYSELESFVRDVLTNDGFALMRPAAPTVTKQPDGTLTVGPPPDGRTVDQHLAALVPSEKACRACGTRHILDTFKPGSRVFTQVDRGAEGSAKPVPAGTLGTVTEWSQYGGPVYVRVEFEIKDDYGYPVRHNYSPCELENA